VGVGNWIALVSALAGLGFSACALWSNARQRNLDLFVQYYRRVVDIVDKLTSAGAKDDVEECERIAFMLAVELEAFAFLVNDKRLNEQKMVEFWKPTLLGWYHSLFPKLIPDWNDNKNYVEFKRLCENLEAGRDDS
jgi:hypothetical protein